MIEINGSYVTGAPQFKLSGAYSAVTQYIKSGGVYIAQNGGVPSPLRIGALNQRFPWSAYGTSGGCTKFQGRVPYKIADDAVSLVFSDVAMSSSNSGNANTGSFTIDEMYIEIGSNVVPVKRGGATSWTINAGEVDVHYDQITPQSMGLGSVIPRGTVVWLRYKGTKANGASLPGSFVSQTVTGAISMFWDPSAGGTVSAVNATGPMTKTGTIYTNYEGYAPVLLASYANGNKRAGVAVGDSLTWGSNYIYTEDVGVVGFGVPMLSQVGALDTDEYIPVMVIANPGNTADDLAGPTNAQHEVYFQYATHGYEAMGTNDIGVNGASTTPDPATTGTATYGWVYGKKSAIWESMRTYGLKLASMVLLPNTSSTDGYTTDTGQTPQTGWGVGGGAEAFRNYILTKKDDGTLDYAVEYNSVRWPGKRWLWASAPDNAYHWGPVLQRIGAADLRAFWLS